MKKPDFPPAFGRTSVIEPATRERRVAMLYEIAKALEQGKLPDEYERLWLAGHLLNFFEGDGDGRVGSLERELGIVGPGRSRLTPKKIHQKQAVASQRAKKRRKRL